MNDEVPDLAAQMPSLIIDRPCSCGQDDCAAFYCEVTPPDEKQKITATAIYGDLGEVLVKVVDGPRIHGVKLLGWPELREADHRAACDRSLLL